MLGSIFSKFASLSYDVFTLVPNTDITNHKSVKEQLCDIRPDVVIHTAAYTDVDGCESNSIKAKLVNEKATQNIAACCEITKSKLVYISSTGVYGDTKSSAYAEDDVPRPTTIHHQSKLDGEIAIVSLLKDYLILRVGWLYGGSPDQKNNFVYKRFLEAQEHDVVYSDPFQIGNPTSCSDVVIQTLLLLEHDETGIFNCVNLGHKVSRFDYVSAIVANFSLDCVVKKAKKGEFSRAAPISRNESAINGRLESLGLNVMRDWKVALTSYIGELNQNL